jgi:hypothetical protein
MEIIYKALYEMDDCASTIHPFMMVAPLHTGTYYITIALQNKHTFC